MNKMSLVFLTLPQVLVLHADQLSRYGGSAGIRDSGLLESAIAMPQQTMFGDYLHCDVFEMAAAYLFHLVQNHPFVDGNKRAGAVAALVFLELNGWSLRVDDDALEQTVLAVASGHVEKPALSVLLRDHSIPLPTNG